MVLGQASSYCRTLPFWQIPGVCIPPQEPQGKYMWFILLLERSLSPLGSYFCFSTSRYLLIVFHHVFTFQSSRHPNPRIRPPLRHPSSPLGKSSKGQNPHLARPHRQHHPPDPHLPNPPLRHLQTHLRQSNLSPHPPTRTRQCRDQRQTRHRLALVHGARQHPRHHERHCRRRPRGFRSSLPFFN